jgi:hypothetical protein
MRRIALSGYGKFLSGLLAGILLTGGVAFATSVNNTPEGGYLLCANSKTRVVTFPTKLTCPSGNVAIEVAGVLSDGLPAQSNSESPQTTASPKSSTQASSGKCNINYLRQHQDQAQSIIDSCPGKDLNALIQEITKATSDTTLSPEDQKSSFNLLSMLVSAISKKVKA